MPNPIASLDTQTDARSWRLADLTSKIFVLHPVLAALAFVLTAGAIIFTRGTGDIAAVWPVNAVLLITLLKSRRAHWPSLFLWFGLGEFSAHLLIGHMRAEALLVLLGHSMEVLIAALIVGRHPASGLISTARVTRLFVGGLLGCLASTAIMMAGWSTLGTPSMLLDGALWFFADFLGLLLFAPLVSALASRQTSKGEQIDWKSFFQMGLVIAVTFGVFAQSNYPFLFFVPPILVPITLRHGVRGAAAALIVVSLIAIPFTYMGSGPTTLTQGDIVIHMLILQSFMAANSFMALALGAAVAERRRLNGQLRNSKRRIMQRSDQKKLLLAKAELAEQISQVGHWTLTPATGEVYWSSEVYRIHGVDPETFDPQLDAAVGFYHGEDEARVSEILARHMASGEDWDFEASLQRRNDGAIRRVRSIAKCHAGPDGSVESIFGVFKDITREYELYEHIAQQEEQYRLLAEHSTDIVLKFGMDGVINYASPSASIIMDPKKAIGMRTVDFVIPEDRAFAIAITQALFKGDEADPNVSREYRVKLADGSIVWLEGNPQIIRDEDGQPVEIVSTFRNVSERHEREKVLAQARLEAEASTVARTEFLSNMSHEIRTPLNGVLGFTDILKSTPLSDEQLSHVQRISSAGRILLEIVNDILDFSKIDAGRLDVEKRPYDLRTVVTDVVNLISAARPNPKVTITHQIAPDVAANVVGDETRTRQILTNLVGNAAKFTEAGHVMVDVRLRGGKICMIVADTGAGIPADKLDHVFTGFSQADSSISRRFGGSGLGLSISRSLAQLMEGDLQLTSIEGEGTNAILTLPYIPDRRTGRTEAGAVKEDRRAPQASRIMVVDDVEMNRALLEIGLQQSGHEVTTFASAPDAILALMEGRMFDIILMDVQMPDMDGLTATRRIRELPGPVSRTPIVALTANVLAGQAEECRAAGMDAHFPKPVDMVRLNGLIDRLLRTKRKEAASQAADAEMKIAKLKDECRKDILELPGQLGALLKIASPVERAKAVAALAHSVAGTTGSLGFSQISDAAFRLQATAKAILEGSSKPAELREAVDDFVSIAAETEAA